MEVDFRGRDSKKTAFKKAIVLDRLKLIRDDLTGATEVYDLEADAQERTNLVARRPEPRKKLMPLLEHSIRRVGAAPADAREIELSPEDLEALRELGYIGP